MRTSRRAALAGERGDARDLARHARAAVGAQQAALGSPRGRASRVRRRHVSRPRRGPGRLRARRRARRCPRGCRAQVVRYPAAPRTRAGTADAASTARSRGTPSSMRFRTASIIVSVLPCEHAVVRAGDAVADVDLDVPSAYAPSPSPAPRSRRSRARAARRRRARAGAPYRGRDGRRPRSPAARRPGGRGRRRRSRIAMSRADASR